VNRCNPSHFSLPLIIFFQFPRWDSCHWDTHGNWNSLYLLAKLLIKKRWVRDKVAEDGPAQLCTIESKLTLSFLGGFQLLHTVFVVERFLQNLLKRHCQFHIAFFGGKNIPPPKSTSKHLHFMQIIQSYVFLQEFRSPTDLDISSHDKWLSATWLPDPSRTTQRSRSTHSHLCRVPSSQNTFKQLQFTLWCRMMAPLFHLARPARPNKTIPLIRRYCEASSGFSISESLMQP